MFDNRIIQKDLNSSAKAVCGEKWCLTRNLNLRNSELLWPRSSVPLGPCCFIFFYQSPAMLCSGKVMFLSFFLNLLSRYHHNDDDPPPLFLMTHQLETSREIHPMMNTCRKRTEQNERHFYHNSSRIFVTSSGVHRLADAEIRKSEHEWGKRKWNGKS